MLFEVWEMKMVVKSFFLLYIYRLLFSLGMKPMLEWWRDAFEEPPFVGQIFANEGMLWMSRVAEMSKLLVVFSSSHVII